MDQKRKQELIEQIAELKEKVVDDTGKKGILQKLNKKASEMSGLFSATSTVGQIISSIMDVIGPFLK